MSKFLRAASTSHVLSVAAMEEASRLGQRDADLEHLLIALTLSEQPAGQVLRSLGITVDACRRAIADLQVHQLSSLGVQAEHATPGTITFHETNGYEWTPRAQKVIVRASSKHNLGDAHAVLYELLAEQSGLIDDLLHRMGSGRTQVLARLDEMKETRTAVPARRRGGVETFIPAPPDQVWALLMEPKRMPEWDPIAASVESPQETPGVGSTWVTWAPRARPDGKPLRIRPAFHRREVTLECAEPESRIEWTFRYPDAPPGIPPPACWCSSNPRPGAASSLCSSSGNADGGGGARSALC